ncbi:MAG: right-handed parallel beta-helix repeat-containing protein [Gemmatimonadales bacterium]
MKRLLLLTCALVACDSAVTEPAAKPSLDVNGVAGACFETPFIRDGRPLTAAVIGTDVAIVRTVIDATGCDIGIYYPPTTTAGSVDQSTVAGAFYFGVVNHSAHVDVTRSSVSNIGDRPFSGAQHGNAIFYTTENQIIDPITGVITVVAAGSTSGVISGNQVSLYQKGGIIVRGAGASAEIFDNEVRGLGPVNFIAQNGIQISFGGSGVVRENIVSENDYTPPGTTSCGILLFEAAGVKVQQNTYFDNETNLCNAGKGSGNVSE